MKMGRMGMRTVEEDRRAKGDVSWIRFVLAFCRHSVYHERFLSGVVVLEQAGAIDAWLAQQMNSGIRLEPRGSPPGCKDCTCGILTHSRTVRRTDTKTQSAPLANDFGPLPHKPLHTQGSGSDEEGGQIGHPVSNAESLADGDREHPLKI